MGDAAGSKSILVMLRYSPGSDICSIVQLDTQLDLKPPPPPPQSHYELKSADAKYLAHFICKATPDFFFTSLISWLFAAPPTSTNDLYVVPVSRPLRAQHAEVHGATFNCSTKMMKPIKTCIAFNPDRISVSVGEDIFFLSHPIDAHLDKIESGFDRYIPGKDEWEKEARFPYRGISGLGHHAIIEAYAVWNEIILLNMGGKQIWAYHVIKRKWYRVLVGNEKADGINYDDKEEVVYKPRRPPLKTFEIDENGNWVESEEDSESEEDQPKEEEDQPKEEEDDVVDHDYEDVEDEEDKEDKNNDLCYAIVDEGFAVNNIIYALSKLSFGSILALSIEEEEDPVGDLQFRCSLHSEYFVPDICEDACFSTGRFLHLGEHNFCLVQSCRLYDSFSDNDQPIQVTYLKLIGGEMVVTNILEHRLITDRSRGQFHLGTCFFKPEFKVTAIKKGETTFEFDPLTGSVLEHEEKTDFNPIMVTQDNNSSGTNIIDEQGPSIIVNNLPLDATTGQLEKGLKEIGPIKRNGIQILTMGNYCFAVVEFESEAAKGRAIKASPIMIGGCLVDIVADRRTSLAKEVDSD